jgi:tetratricopeptide (TPR) repeat protein
MATVAVTALRAHASDAPPAESPPLATPRTIFEQAVAEYDAAAAIRDPASAEARRLYARAASAFAALIQSGIENGHLYYNLANAKLRLGHTGEAIAGYRRADRLMPGDENIRRNLQYARRLAAVNFEPPALSLFRETVFFWHYRTPRAARLWTAVGAWVAFWLLLLALRLARRSVPALRWTAGVLALTALLAGSSVAWEVWSRDHHREGVLVAGDVTLRKGYGEHYDPQLAQTLPEGVEFEVLDSRAGVDGRTWYYIRLPDGKDGWLRADMAELI